MDNAAWEPEDEPTIGLLESDAIDTDLRAALDEIVHEFGGRVLEATAETSCVSDASLVLALEDGTLSTIVRETTQVPIARLSSAHADESMLRAVRTLLAGEGIARQYPVVTVETDEGSHSKALFDVTLVTDEPATISEYSVHSRGESIAQFRADGVVVATPAGSNGYAAAANGASLSPAIDGVAVVPIAPFVTRTRRWILPNDDLTLAVEREDDTVDLCVDDPLLETIDAHTTVSLAVTETVSVLEQPISTADS